MSTNINSSSSGGSQSKPAQNLTSKQPPAEDAATVQTKSWVVASFWLIAVLLGLPVWLWTTSIHRASLPTLDMLAWANDKACQTSIPFIFDIKALTLTDSETQNVMRAVESTLASISSFNTQPFSWNLVETMQRSHSMLSEEPNLSINLIGTSGVSSPSIQLQPHSKALHVQFDEALFRASPDRQSAAMGDKIAGQISQLFTEEQLAVRNLLDSHPSCRNRQQQSGMSWASPEDLDLAAKMAKRRARSLKYASTYHVSISLFTAGSVPNSWQIQEAVAEYFMPLLRSFSISNFTVDAQLQLFASLSPAMRPPQFNWTQQQWLLGEEDLGGFIDTANWPLSPNIGSGPTLNFILYIPEEHLRPLLINGTGSNSWIVPQWGGVSILNAKEQIPTTLSKEDLRPTFSTFSHQLLSLLGISDNSATYSLNLQSLTRVHAFSLILSASSTLGSLARLAESLSTIPIPEEVALRTNRALRYLELARNDLQDGKSRSALDYARLAEIEAEKAFFEKDMVSQVYFPDEHKVAVYLPLLGPIGVTLLASLFREIKKRRSARSQ